MFEDILDFLYSNRFIELFEWAKKASIQNMKLLPMNYLRFLNLLSEGKIDDAIATLEQISTIEVENEKLTITINVIKEKQRILSEIHQFLTRFDKNKPFVNIVLDKYILVGQVLHSSQYSKIDSIEKLKELASNPNLCYHDGNYIEFKGISSIGRLSAIVNDKEFMSQMENIKKYEKVYTFISKINEKMQRYFSENKIGIIVYNQELYLIKFIPMASFDNWDQLSPGKKVSVLDSNFGTIIGILINPDLSFGDMVVFHEESLNSGEVNLRPLISFNISLFESANKKKSGFNLDTDEDINEFINSVKDWIDFGVQILSSNKKIDLKNRQDLYIYTKMELQKLEYEQNLNVKISRLSQLLNFEHEQELEKKIKDELEKTYLIYIRETASKSLPLKIKELLNRLVSFKLFRTDESFTRFMNLYSFILDKYSLDPKEILESIEILDKNWELNDQHYKTIEKIHLTAIAKLIEPQVASGKIQDIMLLIEKNTPKSKMLQNKLNLLILDVAYHIYKNALKKDSKSTISNITFIMFLRKIAIYYDKTFPSISFEVQQEKDQNNEVYKNITMLQQKLDSFFLMMTSQLEFLVFLGEETINDFLELVKDFPSRMLKPQVKEMLISQILKNVVIVIPTHNMYELGKKIIDFLISQKKITQFVSFITNFVENLNSSSLVDINNSNFLESIVIIFEAIESALPMLAINENYLIPYKTEIQKLTHNWYRKGKLPKTDYNLHKRLLQRLSGYIDRNSDVQMMYYMITIKDLIEFNPEKWVNLDNKFSLFIPELTKDRKVRNLFLSEAYKYIEQNKIEDVVMLQKFINIFQLILKYRLELAVENEIIDNLIKLFNTQTENALIYFIKHQENEAIKALFTKIKDIKEILSISVFQSFFNELISNIEFNHERLNGVLDTLQIILETFNLISSIKIETSIFETYLHIITIPILKTETSKNNLISELKELFEAKFEIFIQGLIVAAASYYLSVQSQFQTQFQSQSQSQSQNTSQSSNILNEIFSFYFQIILFNLEFASMANQIKQKIEMLLFLFRNNRIHLQSKNILLNILFNIVKSYNFYDLFDLINNEITVCGKLESVKEYLDNKIRNQQSVKQKSDEQIEIDIEYLMKEKETFQNDFFYQYYLGLYFFYKQKYQTAEVFLEKAFVLDCPESLKLKKYRNYMFLLHKLNKKQELMKIYIEAPSDVKENETFREYIKPLGLGQS